MRGDSKFAFALLALGVAPALIKKSKSLSHYVGDQLVRAGEYFLHDEEPAAKEEPVTAPPVVSPEEPISVPIEDIVEIPEEEVAAEESPAVAEEAIGSASVEGGEEAPAEEPTDPASEPVTDEKIEGESHQSWD